MKASRGKEGQQIKEIVMLKIKFSIKFATNAIIFLLCFFFVTYQCFECINRFIAGPIGTEITLDSASSKPFPSITICPFIPGADIGDLYSQVLNQTYLDNCGLR